MLAWRSLGALARSWPQGPSFAFRPTPPPAFACRFSAWQTSLLRSSAGAQRLLPPPRVADCCAPPATMVQQHSYATWDGSGSQEELMHKDECILVDAKDQIVGHDNKYNSHRFVAGQSTGLLHRAFSVFLFNADNQLLLQQRAASKITFPKVWTNTCCSHPLYGYDPPEIDSPEQIAAGSVQGIKAAAVRKLGHELGIPASQLPVSGFKFLTRLHYCAADTHTYGEGAEWGEHEIDYVLFIRTHVDLRPNPEEVGGTKYVTLPQLRGMMAPGSGLLWSPWFRIMAEHFVEEWWQDLDNTLSTDRFVDGKIHSILT